MSLIDQYLDRLEPPQKNELERVRNVIKKLAPDAVEVISYGMPVFKFKNKYLIGFAAFKNHMSLFPGEIPPEMLNEELSKFKRSKGTIQFTIDNPVPESIIRELINKRLAISDKHTY